MNTPASEATVSNQRKVHHPDTQALLSPGTSVLVRGRMAKFVGAASLTNWHVSYVGTGATELVPANDVDIIRIDPPPTQTTPDETRPIADSEWTLACTLEVLIRPLAEHGSTNEEIRAVAKTLGCARSKIWRLVSRYRKDPSPQSLLPRKRGRKSGNRILDPVVDLLIRSTYERLAKNNKGFRICDLIQALVVPLKNLNLTVSRKAIEARVTSYPPDLQLRARLGKALARERTRLIKGELHASRPLELMQADFTVADLFIVDDVSRQPIGRPYLGLTIDIESRVIMGFVLFLEAPSHLTAGWLITTSVFPKEALLKELELDFEWPCFGKPEAIHVDNGFRCKAFEDGCKENGINLLFRPPATPRYGGHIERLVGTMMGRLRMLPGATLADPLLLRKRKVKPHKSACLTLSEARAYIANEINKYHHTDHRALGEPPIDVWLRSFQTPQGLLCPAPPAEARTFMIRFLWNRECMVTRAGITADSVTYNGPELADLVGSKIKCHFNRAKLSPIYAKIGDRFFEIHSTDRALGERSWWELRAAKRFSSKSPNRAAHQAEIARSIAVTDALVANAKNEKLRRDRQRRADRSTMVIAQTTDRDATIDFATPPARTSVGTWDED